MESKASREVAFLLYKQQTSRRRKQNSLQPTALHTEIPQKQYFCSLSIVSDL